MAHPTHNPLFSQRGVALIAVAGALAMLAVVTAEFTVDTDVDYEAAKNAQDDMRAHFLARSAMNLGEVIVKVQITLLDQFREQLGDIQLGDYAPLFIGAFGGSPEDVAIIGEALGGIPGDALEGLGVPEGSFDLQIGTEDGKININCAMNSGETLEVLAAQLGAMLYPVAYDELFQRPDADGWTRGREEQVSAMLDYVDKINTRHGAPGTPEDYGYESLDDPYKPKNNYLDTVGELQLARGVDDRFWTLFGDAFTVYGGCKVNLSAVKDVNIVAAVIYVAAKNADDPVRNDPQKLWELAQFVISARDMGMPFSDNERFADFVKDPAAALGGLLDAAGGGNTGAASNLFPVGVELDSDKLGRMAGTGSRRTYRIEATGQIGRVEKRIIGVWDKQPQRQNARPQHLGQGAWVLWREQ